MNEGRWLDLVENLLDHVPHLPDVKQVELRIRCQRTMKLVNAVLDRLKVITCLDVDVCGVEPWPRCTEEFIQVLDRSGPLFFLSLERITGRWFDFWPKLLEYAFRKPPRGNLAAP